MNNSTFLEYSSSQEEWAMLLLTNKIVYRVYFLFLILAGTCGNSLTVLTLLRDKLRKYTTCQYMAVCAILNIGVLLTNTLNLMLTLGYNIHFRSQFGIAWCRVNAFIAQWIRGMAAWVLVIVAVDRFRQSKKVYRTQKTNDHTVILTIILTGSVIFILNLHYLLFAGNRVILAENTRFLACIFDKSSTNRAQRFFAATNIWYELVILVIIPCIVTMILNIFIIKNSFLVPTNNEHLKSRSKSRTRRVTTMLLASSIGYLALVGPTQIFFAITFDPERGMQSNDGYKSFMIQGNIYQCLINTYYAASFVFCFASSSMFRREICKIFYKQYRPKLSVITATSDIFSTNEQQRAFLSQARLSGTFYSNGGSPQTEVICGRKRRKRETESTIETDGFI